MNQTKLRSVSIGSDWFQTEPNKVGYFFGLVWTFGFVGFVRTTYTRMNIGHSTSSYCIICHLKYVKSSFF